jgi:hypothetical protein
MGGANALGLAKELGSIEVGKCFDALVLDVAGGGVDLFDAGTQFTCFTGTKAQILTQKALLDEPRSILEKLLNLGTEHNVSKVWVQGRIVHHKKIVRLTNAARMSVNKDGNGFRDCGSSPRKLGTQFTRFTGTKVQTLTQKALLAPDEHRPNVPWHLQQGATSPRSRQVGDVTLWGKGGVGGATMHLGEIEARLSEMEGRDNRHIQLPCIASTSSNNTCPRVLPTSPRTQASSPSPPTQASSPSPARAPASLGRKTSGHESVPATPPLNFGTLTGSLAICRHDDDRSESQAFLTPPKAALRLGLVDLHREAILPSPPPALGRSCAASTRTHSPKTPPEPKSPPRGFEGDDETSSDFEYSFSDTDQDVAYFVGRENVLGAC